MPEAHWLAGVDEAGRGPLAGPVVAAAVILDPARPIAGLADSKALEPEVRVERVRSQRQGFAVRLVGFREGLHARFARRELHGKAPPGHPGVVKEEP